MSNNHNDQKDNTLSILILFVAWIANLFIFFTSDFESGGLSLAASLVYFLWIAGIFLIPQHRGFDTSTYLHPHPINEGVKRGEGG